MLSVVSAVVAIMLRCESSDRNGSKVERREVECDEAATKTLKPQGPRAVARLSVDRRITAIGTAALQRDRRGTRHVVGAQSVAFASPDWRFS